MTHSIYPCLWFEENAQAAFEWYGSIFPHSHMIETNPYAAKASFSGVPFLGMNGGPTFHPNPSISFMVICESPNEIDHLWNRLIEGGSILMELGQYAWSDYYGWLQDQYGFSWQIHPENLSEIFKQNPHAQAAAFKMKKLVIEDLIHA